MLLKYIWLVFAFIFGVFALYHFWRSATNIPKAPNNAKIKTLNGSPLGIFEFITDFNSYVDNLNKDNKKVNTWTGIAYLINALIAIFSYIIS